jgi:hypothetical protein
MTICERARVAALGAACVLLCACGDYQRDSGFDPNVHVNLFISGPDSAVAVGDTVRFALTTVPAYPHEPAHWDVINNEGSVEVSIDQTGKLTITRDPNTLSSGGGRQYMRIRATLGGGRSATRLFYFRHDAIGLYLDDCYGHKAITLDSLRPTAALCAVYVDKRGVHFENTPPQSLRASARTGGIVSLSLEPQRPTDDWSVGRVNVGTSYVVMTSGSFADSVLVTVADTIPRRY